MRSPITFEIRKARPEDAPALSQLAIHAKAYWGYSPAFMTACRPELTYTSAQIIHPQFHFFLAETGDRLIGFYGLEPCSAQEMELLALFVSPAFIRQGYGRILMQHAQKQAMACGTQTLMIQSDPNAEAFYLAMGARAIAKTESASISGRYLPLLVLDLANCCQ
ncbi:GNAT family N-acetyltransferase [Acaryochloris sp. IP29b_bin.148]|uniref:GNAT family N-acetyltransferase n=1 Tax=Acaryochloris sp. IP29b_bin.148 TaxID=2969218 RepID=UPI00260FC0A1|nr:GNAT family N-acetyltransferase [Acaryochloris sp. IP29b_bin.148]